MKKPNIVFIMADHQLFYRHGWDMGPQIIRNNYKKFASEGVEFNRAYSSNPLCGPTRCSILSGQYSHKHGEILNDVNAPKLNRSYLQILKDDGYKNYYFGKWHAGSGTAYDHGCEGYCYPSYGNPYLTKEYEEYKTDRGLSQPKIMIECTMDPWRLDMVPGQIYVQDKELTNEEASGIMLNPKESHEAFFLANLACDKLEDLAKDVSDKPFSLRVDFWGPHDPYFVTQEYADMYDPSEIPEYPTFNSPLADKPSCYKKEHNLGISDENKNLIYPNPIPWETWQLLLARCYAHITMVDDAAGMILDKLRELGLSENTLVMWTADHGDALACQGGKFDKASYMVEEVMRVPLAMRYPTEVKPFQVTDALVSNLDVPVTLLNAAGLEFDHKPDGKSLLDLERSKFKERRDYFVSETYGHLHKNVAKSLVTARYKYTVNKEDISELYDLVKDPYETTNLINNEQHKSLIIELDGKLREWAEENHDTFFDYDSNTILKKYLEVAQNESRDY